MSEHIKSILGEVLLSLKKNSEDKQKIYDVFGNVLDNASQKHIKNLRLYKNSLIVYVDSSIWAYQVNLYKKEILNQVGKIDGKIEKIKIKVKER